MKFFCSVAATGSGGFAQPAPTPEELGPDAELQPEGMMFVGDKGKILGGFHGEAARIILEPGNSNTEVGAQKPEGRTRRSEAVAHWVAAAKGGKPTYGDFLLAGPISDAFNLGAVSLRLGGRRLRFDSAHRKVTNVPEANGLLSREYRKGWELTGA